MLTRLTAPGYTTILPLAEARRHLNQGSATTDDTLITELAAAAIDWVEAYAKTSLEDTRSYRWNIDDFTSELTFPITPVNTVTALAYYNTSDVSTALVSTDWSLGNSRLIATDVWPTTNGRPGNVAVTFTAGTPNKWLVVAAKLALAEMYDNREAPSFDAAMRVANQVRQPTI